MSLLTEVFGEVFLDIGLSFISSSIWLVFKTSDAEKKLDK